MTSPFSFPNPVNERAARSVAGIVLVLALATLATRGWWLLAVLAAGFALRVAGGPRYSPTGQLATRVIAPRLGRPKLVAGPPKRFAQAIGLVVTGAGAVAWFAFGSAATAASLTGIIVVAAGLESIVGFCLGCWIFARLINAGLVPERVCAACAIADPA
ncbi:MAG: hypothetical protein JWO69_281 [Thermoleophilia bacterium]|jgi:hypothetical protein|nr:hypothetical protein [Thermoleophilia bacterium]